MNDITNRQRILVTYGTFAILYLAAVIRSLEYYLESPDTRLIFGLLALYAVLLIAEPFLAPHWRYYVPLYLAGQTAIVCALILFPQRPLDYFAILIIPLGPLAVQRLPRRQGVLSTVLILVGVSICLLLRFDLSEAVSYVITYIAGMAFLTAFAVARLNAESATQESQRLLGELTSAHEKLQRYAAQVEELAAAQERNRLARELHDSVTQTIFSMTLTAQSARILLERDPSRVAAQLDRLQDLAQSALTEMRSLIQQLRPKSLAEEGLVAALRRHAAERQAQDGLTVEVEVKGARRLPAALEETLFRVAQEALNNIVKHAGTSQAWLRLAVDDSPVCLEIEDRGTGFDLALVGSAPGHMGLAGMAERVKAQGGSLEIQSAPGRGTIIRATIAQSEG